MWRIVSCMRKRFEYIFENISKYKNNKIYIFRIYE